MSNPHLSHVAKASVKADFSAVRWASALRRGGVVIAILIGFSLAFNAGVGTHAATSAMLIGLLDKGRSPRVTWHIMATATAAFAVTTVVVGYLAHDPVPIIALMALLAFCAGVSTGVDPRAPQIFVYCAVLTATALLVPPPRDEVLTGAALVIVAGGIQTLFALLSAPIIRDLPERRVTVNALLSVAEACLRIGRADPPGYAKISAAAMSEAEGLVSKSDMSSNARLQYAQLLGRADILRLEARSFFARERMGVRTPVDPRTRAAFLTAGDALTHAAEALTRGGPVSALPNLDADVRAARAELETGHLTRTATAVLEAAMELPDLVQSILQRTRVRRSHRSAPDALRTRIAKSIQPGSLPFKHGVRMAAAATTGELVARYFGLAHGSWVAVTSMMLLRADSGPTAPRIVMRAVGTTAGTIVVVIIAWLCGGTEPLLVLFAGISVITMYALVSVSYNFLVGMMAVTVLLIMSIDGQDTISLAWVRWTDVLVGCVIGTVYALLFPLWKRETLAVDTASYAQACSEYFDTVSTIAETDPADRTSEAFESLRKLGNQCRTTRLAADTTLQTSLLEPPAAKQISPAIVANMLEIIRRCTDGGIAAETLLRHGAAESNRGAELARDASVDLAEVAKRLRSGQIPDIDFTAKTSEWAPADTDDRLAEVLLPAARRSGAALRFSETGGSG